MTHVLFSNIVFLSLFYWGLSILALRMIIHERRQQLYLFSGVYLAVSVGIGLSGAMKWLLAASLLFMVVSSTLTLWILLKQSRECMRDLEILHEKEIQAKRFKKEESPHGE